MSVSAYAITSLRVSRGCEVSLIALSGLFQGGRPILRSPCQLHQVSLPMSLSYLQLHRLRAERRTTSPR